MTLLHVLGGDSMGGCERLSIDLASHYAHTRKVKQVALFYGDAGSGPAWIEFQKLGVETVAIPYDGRKLAFVRDVRRMCRSRKVDRVLTHGFGMHLLIAIGARLAGAHRILALVGNPPPEDPNVLRRVRRRAQMARPLVSGEVACSEYVRLQMIQQYRLPPTRVWVVYPSARVNEVSRRSEARRHEQKYGHDQNRGPVIIMVARLDPIKDHATVIRAISILKESFPDVRLRLVGDGPIRDSLQTLATELGVKDSVEFTGARHDIPEQLGGADIFVYGTTANEGFGIVLAEAMAARLPIVCTDVGPCREVLDEGRAGVLVEPGNPLAMAGALECLLRDRDAADQMAIRGLEHARHHYSVEQVASQYDSLLGW